MGLEDFDTINMKVKDFVINEKLSESLKVNYNKVDLAKKMCETPAIYGYWLMIQNEQNRIVSELKDSFDIWLSNAKREVRQSVGKAVTETSVKESVMLQKKMSKKGKEISVYKTKTDKIREEEFKLKTISNVIKSFEVLFKMLQSIGAMRRSEMKMSNPDIPEFSDGDEHSLDDLDN